MVCEGGQSSAYSLNGSDGVVKVVKKCFQFFTI